MTTVITKLTIDDIRDLVRSAEPSASVYWAGVTPAQADMSIDTALRRRAISADLQAQGADAATITAIDDHLLQLAYPIETAVFAAAGQIRQFHPLPGGIGRDVARFAAPATVTPLLRWLQGRPAHLVVVADRLGADITAVAQGAVQGSSRTVTGPDDDITRNAPGGWSKRRSEDSWLHNAAAVAEEITTWLAGIGGRLVILAGDVRACQLITNRLARTGMRPDVRLIAGSRSPDGAVPHVQSAAVADTLSAYAEEQQRMAVARFNAAWGQSRTAVHGADETLSALADRRVATLVVATDGDDRFAWFTPDGWCGTDMAPRPAHAIHGGLVDVAVRSALLADAEVRVMPADSGGGIAEGIGAICRYA